MRTAIAHLDRVRDGALLEGDVGHAGFGDFAAFADGVGDFAGLAETDANPALAIADNDERAKAEPAAAFDDFGGAIDKNDLLGQFLALAIAAFTGARTARTTRTAGTTAFATVTALWWTAGLGLGFGRGGFRLGHCFGGGAFYIRWCWNVFVSHNNSPAKISVLLRARHQPAL